jgi:hypothetical protein
VAALVTSEEEESLTRLLESQPESTGELNELLERIKDRVAEATLQEESVRERLARNRRRVLAVDWRDDKPNGEEPDRRLAEVAIYDYDRDVLMIAVVDLHEGSVRELFDRERASPPITAEELAEAREVAGPASSWPEDDANIVAFPAPRYAFEPRSERQRHRICTLYRAAGEEDVYSITVDLSAREVVPEHELPDILRSTGDTSGF